MGTEPALRAAGPSGRGGRETGDGTPQAAADGANLPWLDLVRGFALLWIAASHVVERLLGFPYMANPSADWPPLWDRIAQLAPFTGHGAWDVPLDALRAVGWTGDQGVQLFLIASGFGLAWGPLRRAGRAAPVPALPAGPFLRRRLARIVPEWWGAHLLFALAALLVGRGFDPGTWEFWASFAGFRATPHLLYVFTPSWWYVGLILQLYLVFPLLWAAMRRWGAGRMLAGACLLGFVARGVGLLTMTGWLDAWNRGAVFVTRLPEFAFGVALAAAWAREPERTRVALRRARTLGLAVVAYMAGTAASFTLSGMTVAPFLLGVAAFVLLHALFAPWAWRGPVARALAWVGRHSYVLFLLHHPFVTWLVPRGLAHGRRAALGIAAAAALTVLLGLLLEAALRGAARAWHAARERRGTGGAATATAGGLALLLALLVGAELVSRRVAPQEIDGWGERAALEPDARFGWRMRPSRSTRLRWTGYDYVVESDSLGFPAPAFPETRPPGVTRILVTGDAFSSAEGVPTSAAWPRLLETRLAASTGRPVEVLNFAVTGYGPRQYAAVVRAFAPRYRPDLVLVECFVNDLQDVMTSDSTFLASMGLERPPADGWRAIASLANLRALARVAVAEPLRERLRGTPRPQGYVLGAFAALERGRLRDPAPRAALARQLADIRATAGRIQAGTLVLLVPAAPQVCRRRDLAYFPRPLDLADTMRFDVDGPSRVFRSVADSLGIPLLDLRPALSAPPCAYQRGNMHWTADGHRRVAAWLADTLARRWAARP